MPSNRNAIREVRKRTSASLTDCIQALDQSKGDIEHAVQVLRSQQIQQFAAQTGASIEACRDALSKTDSDADRALLVLHHARHLTERPGYIQSLLAKGTAPTATTHAIYTYLQSLDDEARTPAEQVVFLVMDLVTQVRGDGFDSFFEHMSSQTLIQATAHALQEIGATDTSMLFQTAMTIAQDAEQDDWLGAMGPLDHRFYEANEPIEERVVEYIAAHVTDFS